MRNRRTRAILAATLVGVVSGWPHAVQADDKKDCLDAYDKAQTLVKANKLVEGQQQLLVCGRKACPGFVADDCGRWLSDVEARMPSIVLEARGPDGQDLTDVVVEVDGKPFQARIDGRSAPIDPGAHTFRFTTPGASPIEQRYVIAESVKGRRISVQFGGGASADAGTGPSPTPADAGVTTPAPTPETGGVPTLTWVLGGIGLVGLAGFTYFGLDYDKRLNDLDPCKPYCEKADTDRASTSRLLAFVSGGVGIAALGGAAIVYLARPSAPAASTDSARRRPLLPVDIVAVPGGAVGVFRGEL